MILESYCVPGTVLHITKCLVSFNFLNKAIRQLLFSLLCRWRNWGSEKIEQLLKCRARGQSRDPEFVLRSQGQHLSVPRCLSVDSGGLEGCEDAQARVRVWGWVKALSLRCKGQLESQSRKEGFAAQSVSACMVSQLFCGPSPWLRSRMAEFLRTEWGWGSLCLLRASCALARLLVFAGFIPYTTNRSLFCYLNGTSLATWLIWNVRRLILYSNDLQLGTPSMRGCRAFALKN